MQPLSIRVGDLIRDTEILQNPARATHCGISFLLPTYHGMHDGSVPRLISSLLQIQTFSWELIVVDDGSADGTREYFLDLMAQDPRFVYMRHPKNIGLPAISEFEAYQESRASRIAFLFDDVELIPRNFEKLYDFAIAEDRPFVHGELELIYRTKFGLPKTMEIGRHHLNSLSEGLLHSNKIGNSSVIVRRDVLENVGLYDPHVSLSRLNDWDLWIRISKEYVIEFLPAVVAREFGPVRSSSLGNQYPLDPALVSGRITMNRKEMLRPANFANVDTIATDGFKASLHSGILDVSNMHLRNSRIPKAPLKGLMFGEFSMSSHLVFEELNHEDYSLDLYRWTEDIPTMLLEGCRYDFIVISRSLAAFEKNGLLQLWKKAGVPVFYFVDDNFSLLAAQDPIWLWYESPAFTKALRKLRGVICPSTKLTDYYRYKLKVKNSFTVPISIPRTDSRMTRAPGPIRIAVIGGAHRDAAELLTKIQGRFGDRVELFLTERLRSKPSHLQAQWIPVESSAYQFLNRWHVLKPDILLHPPSRSENAQYKTANIFAIAHLLGAVPLTFDENYLRDIPWGLKSRVDDDTLAHLEMFVREPVQLAAWLEKLDGFQAKFFSPEASSQIFANVLKSCDVQPTAPNVSTRKMIRTLLNRRYRAPHRRTSVRWIYILRQIYGNRLILPWLRPLAQKFPVLARLKRRFKNQII